MEFKPTDLKSSKNGENITLPKQRRRTPSGVIEGYTLSPDGKMHQIVSVILSSTKPQALIE